MGWEMRRLLALALLVLSVTRSCGAVAGARGRNLWDMARAMPGFRLPAAAVTSKAARPGRPGGEKWDTKAFLRAFVDAQRDQIRFEVERVAAFVPSNVISTHRKPTEVARDVGKLVADTGISYMQSAMMGYLFGFIGGLTMPAAKKAVYKKFFGRLGPHKKGLKQAKQFGEFCAAFTLFEGGLQVVRGINDKWNSVVGSYGVGMYTTRKRPLPEQIKSGLAFAAFNYFLSGFAPPVPQTPEEDGKAREKNPKQLLREPPKAKDKLQSDGKNWV